MTYLIYLCIGIFSYLLWPEGGIIAGAALVYIMYMWKKVDESN